ncbi:Gp37-like protein [Tomitella fengzijianii]|uniref:Gp28/Gp37-like domain-containing protein n=1 Tax=Tomitella fengzijianii TaxID=2597660 RepID=A0A516X4J9_9ACTN|nr:hypothetical protein [Tomitella fengzijianii]QDQ97987.1 hypothetical protein FO059_12505 [Tomitella fengzijianii]
MAYETGLVTPTPVDDPARPLTTDEALEWRDRLTVHVDHDYELIVYTPDGAAPLDAVVGYSEASTTWARNTPGTTDIDLPHDHRLADVWESVHRTVVPIRAVHNGRKWDGLVTGAKLSGTGPDRKYHVEAVSVYAYLAAIMGQPMPTLPLWVQFPPEGFLAGPLPAVIYYFLTPNLDRLGIPYAAEPYDVLGDATSPWVSLITRETPLDELFADVLKSTGSELRVEWWHPGDPQPWEGANLTRSCLTFRIIQPERHGGFQLGTNTLLDGLARTIAELIADAAAGLLGGLIPGLAESIYDDLATYEVPAIVWHDGMAAIEDATIEWKHPTATTVIVGGKSPGWMNKLVSGGVEAAISTILTVAEIPIPGLASFAKNILDDVFLAFEAHTDTVAAEALGIFRLREAFKDGGSAAFTPDAAQAAAAGLYENAGAVSASIKTADGVPHHVWHDYDLGTPIAWDTRGTIFADRISEVTVVDTPATGVQVKANAGSDDPDQDLGTTLAERIKQLERFVKAATLNMH